VLLPALALLGVPYLEARETRGERGRGEVAIGSALPSDYGSSHARLHSYSWHSRRGNRPERELFPGTSPIVLATAGMIPPLGAAAMATIVSGALAFDWSLGFNGLTYDDIYKRSAAHRGMRVPARFSVVVGAALALLAGFGARRLLGAAGLGIPGSVLCAGLAVAVLFDLRLDPRLESYFPTIPSIYARVTSDMVLVEFPRYHDVEYMYFSTRHWAHLLGGYSGFIPFDGEVEGGLSGFPAPAALDRLHRRGATHVTYNCALETRRERCDAILEQLADNPTLELVASERWQNAAVVLYRFK
jgi:hypothetical protein